MLNTQCSSERDSFEIAEIAIRLELIAITAKNTCIAEKKGIRITVLHH